MTATTPATAAPVAVPPPATPVQKVKDDVWSRHARATKLWFSGWLTLLFLAVGSMMGSLRLLDLIEIFRDLGSIPLGLSNVELSAVFGLLSVLVAPFAVLATWCFARWLKCILWSFTAHQHDKPSETRKSPSS